jgi:hypothetical protein
MNPELDAARCDFCMAGNPAEIYMVVTKPFALGTDAPGTPVIVSTGEWAACGDCLQDLERERFAAIFARWYTRVGIRIGAPVTTLRRATITVWRRAWEQRTATRPATYEDRLTMIANLDKFRRDTPDRNLP